MTLPGCQKTLEIAQLFWWAGSESNTRHKDFQSFALPTELPAHRDGRRGRETALRADINSYLSDARRATPSRVVRFGACLFGLIRSERIPRFAPKAFGTGRMTRDSFTRAGSVIAGQQTRGQPPDGLLSEPAGTLRGVGEEGGPSKLTIIRRLSLLNLVGLKVLLLVAVESGTEGIAPSVAQTCPQLAAKRKRARNRTSYWVSTGGSGASGYGSQKAPQLMSWLKSGFSPRGASESFERNCRQRDQQQRHFVHGAGLPRFGGNLRRVHHRHDHHPQHDQPHAVERRRDWLGLGTVQRGQLSGAADGDARDVGRLQHSDDHQRRSITRNRFELFLEQLWDGGAIYTNGAQGLDYAHPPILPFHQPDIHQQRPDNVGGRRAQLDTGAGGRAGNGRAVVGAGQ